jgi:hypothetical protein
MSDITSAASQLTDAVYSRKPGFGHCVRDVTAARSGFRLDVFRAMDHIRPSERISTAQSMSAMREPDRLVRQLTDCSSRACWWLELPLLWFRV